VTVVPGGRSARHASTNGRGHGAPYQFDGERSLLTIVLPDRGLHEDTGDQVMASCSAFGLSPRTSCRAIGAAPSRPPWSAPRSGAGRTVRSAFTQWFAGLIQPFDPPLAAAWADRSAPGCRSWAGDGQADRAVPRETIAARTSAASGRGRPLGRPRHERVQDSTASPSHGHVFGITAPERRREDLAPYQRIGLPARGQRSRESQVLG
jgi:hypothetical protein